MNYDIAIIGGGLVGAGLAVALRQSGLSVVLIDARRPSAQDSRLFALSYGSCQFLQDLGLWSRLQDQATALLQVHVSRKHRFGALRLHASELGLDALGYTIPAGYLEQVLNDELAHLPRFTLYRPACLNALHQDDEAVFLTFSTEENKEITVQSRFVIGADGTESSVRRLLNMTAEITDYQQQAIVASVNVTTPHQHVAYERFTDQGVIAVLPAKQACKAIWSVKTDRAQYLLSLTDQDFLHILQKEFGWRLGRLENIQSRHTFMLRQVYAPQAVLGRALLLGNAAHTLHPVAAQGFNLALHEVRILVSEIMKCDKLIPDILQQTFKKSRLPRTLSRMMSHYLPGICSTTLPFLDESVQCGLVGLNMLTPIKKMWMQRLVLPGLN